MKKFICIILQFAGLAGETLIPQMKLGLILSSLLLLVFFRVFGQQETYFYKIQTVTAKVQLDTELYKKIDSIKQTRRPNDSYIRLLFNRDIDFGYRHKRIQIEFNSTYYQVNLLTKNDSVCLSSTTFSSLFDISEYNIQFNKKHSVPNVDSAKALNYLKLRNGFYHSSKTLSDLKNELDFNELYALSGGDQYGDTPDKLHIDTLVKRRDFKGLEKMLKNINCETQTYGVTGFDLLKKSRVKIPLDDARIIAHIKERNSDLESCEGDICPIIWKAYK